MEDIKTNIYSTKDITLASTLVTMKFFMCGIDYQLNGQKNKPECYFKFENTEDLKKAVDKYKQMMLAVEPKMFMTNLRALKSEADNIHNNPHL